MKYLLPTCVLYIKVLCIRVTYQGSHFNINVDPNHIRINEYRILGYLIIEFLKLGISLALKETEFTGLHERVEGL